MKKFSLTSASNSQAGFTLLEILIAITILAFMTLGVVSITENAANTKERTTEINKNNLQIETAMSRFEWDFSQIYSPLYFSTVMNLNAGTQDPYGQNPNGTNSANPTAPVAAPNPMLQEYHQQLIQRFERNEHFMAVSQEGIPIPRFYSPDKTVFEFFTTSNRRKLENTKQSHFAWVRYALADAPEELDKDLEKNAAIPKGLKNFVRYFSAEDPYSDKRLDPTSGTKDLRGAILLENVEKLEFQYWDYNRKKWETSLRTIQNGESLIRGVKIIITWYDSTGNKRSSTRTFRNLWPMVTPTDQPTAGGITGGVNGGGTSGGGTSGGY